MKPSSAQGIKAADGFLHRWLPPLLFVGVVALSVTLLYRATAPVVFVSSTSRRVDFIHAYPVVPKQQLAASVPPPSLYPPPELQYEPASSAPAVPQDATESQEMRLERVLKAAATADNAVIITSLNAFWSTPGSVLDVFLESFRIGNGTRELLNHLVIVAVDDKAYERCVAVHRHCLDFKVEGVDFSAEKVFNSPEYLDMMWARLDFLRLVLEKGFDFVFSDVDIMWFRNPFPYFYSDGDFQISCDRFKGDPTDLKNSPNNGFNYARSNNRTIEFFKYWYSSRARFPGVHEQNVLNIIKFDQHIRDIGVKLRFLSTERFGGFCEPSRNFNKVCTMHANCCIGLRRKINDLRAMLDDWRNFTSLPPDVRISSNFKWSVPQTCRIPPGFFSKKEKTPQV
ncbi:uncharacterized protein At4g15970-like [Zingiber officinale]|uniref:Nucleotide-diphospho-sugar transferase domain-containing protein n=1 Tax=Zingiber officinale TaxID=94328 RepID=A0A8J5L5L8_ZINOF|nr:uncharacterized protein At4g15970-like [Zingiber officinale]KAG6507023.1 hypothetical protein ZIOFF_032358 [Zingiber officinale]